MSYRLRHKIANGSWIERTYYEKIDVVDGECEVERVQTRDALLRKNFIEVSAEDEAKSAKPEPKKKAKKEKAKKS